MSTITPLPKNMTAEAVAEVRAAIQLANVRHEADRVWPILARCKPSLRVGLQEIARGIEERDHAAVKQRNITLMAALGRPVVSMAVHLQAIQRAMDAGDVISREIETDLLMAAVDWVADEIDDHDATIIGADVATFDAARVAVVLEWFSSFEDW